jgi:hypothetical protein
MIIYKYELEVADIQKISMPRDAEILSAGTQGEKVFIWAGVNPYKEKEERFFKIVGTGHGQYEPRTTEFLGTIFAGQYVWHIFEVVR